VTGRRGLAAALVAVALALPAQAKKPPASQKAPTVDGLLAEVEKARAGTDTLAADFTQKKRLSLFKDELQSKGLLRFQRPDRLRWEYTAPEPSVVVIDGTKVWVRTGRGTPESYDLAAQPGMRTLFDQLLLWLGRGSLRTAAKDYDLTVVGPQALRLVPRGALKDHVLEVEMRFDQAWQLAFVRLREKAGDVTEITFANLKRNVKLDDKVFRP
jgi:outer membrane lipoprotein-sorting protein